MKQITFWSLILLGISMCFYTETHRDTTSIQEVELVFYKYAENGIIMVDEDSNEYFVDNETLEVANIGDIKKDVAVAGVNEYGEILTLK